MTIPLESISEILEGTFSLTTCDTRGNKFPGAKFFIQRPYQMVAMFKVTKMFLTIKYVEKLVLDATD